MALIKVSTSKITEMFVAEEPIGTLASVYLSDDKKVKEGVTAFQERARGVVLAAVLSGNLARVVTHGIISGLICASSINAGDRVAIANSSGYAHASGLVSGHGMITPFNTITPSGSLTRVSGFITLVSGSLVGASGFYSGFIGIDGTSLFGHGGLISGVTGFTGEAPTFTGTAFNTGRVLGMALQSGGFGSGIRVLVDKGG